MHTTPRARARLRIEASDSFFDPPGEIKFPSFRSSRLCEDRHALGITDLSANLPTVI